MPRDDAEASADGSATGSLLPPRSANTSNSNFAAVPPPHHHPQSRDGSTSPVRRVGSRPTLSGFPRSASTGTFHPSYFRRSSSQANLQNSSNNNLQNLHLHHRHDESHPPHVMTRWGEDLVEGARLPRARGAGATLAESRSVVAALVAKHDADKAARVKKQTSDGGVDDDGGGGGERAGNGGNGGGDAKLDLGDNPDGDADHHLAVEDGPWYRQITLRSLVFGTLLGVLFAVITNKLNLTAGIIPSLGMAATLLGYFAMNGWSRLVRRCGFESAPFSQQENTMMQTFISACAGAAFSGGFGSYLIAMDRQSYENVGTGTPGNRPEDVFEPSLARTIPYMFCISFVGIFMLVQLRKRFIIDYDLPYPSGTAGGVLINSLHSRGGEAAANAQVAALGKWGGASACWSAFKWFFSSDAGANCSGGFDRFPSFGLKALAWKWNFDFQLTYLGVGMICPHAVNLSMLAGAVLTWGFAWPMIAKKEGDWYPKGLKEKDFRGLYGYQVFLAIAVFMGDGLYNLAKIGFVSARAYADQRRELAEALAAQREALRGGSSDEGGGGDNGGSLPPFLPTAAPGAPPSAAAAARAREQAHERRVAGATRLRLMASFRRGMTALEPKKRSSAVGDAACNDDGDESPRSPSSPSSSLASAAAATAATAAASRPPLAPPPTDRELQARPSAAAQDKVMPSASSSPRSPSANRPSAAGLACRRPRLPSRDDDDARARAALDDRRDEIFMRDAIPAWVGYVGYLAFGLLGVTVIPLLYPACKWYMVAAAYAVAPAFCFANAYAAGLTDWDMASMYGKLCIFGFAAWGGVAGGGVISGLAICGVVLSTTSAAAGLMFDFKTGWTTLSSPRAMFVAQTVGSAIGCVVGPTTFYLFYRAFPIGAEHSEYPAPYATIYRGMAILGTQGFGALPSHCLEMFAGVFAGSLLISLARDVLPAKVAAWVPIPTAAGLTFYLGPNYAVSMCMGSAIKYLWEKRNPASADELLVPTAAGLIIGDGMWAVPSAMLSMAKVRPPICMSFTKAVAEVAVVAGGTAAAVAAAPAAAVVAAAATGG